VAICDLPGAASVNSGPCSTATEKSKLSPQGNELCQCMEWALQQSRLQWGIEMRMKPCMVAGWQPEAGDSAQCCLDFRPEETETIDMCRPQWLRN
jgi:hypothetical protein